MNKNIEAKLREFEKRRVKNLRQTHKDPKDLQLRVESIELRQEMFDWLKELSCYKYADDVSKLQIDNIIEAIWNRILDYCRYEEKVEDLIENKVESKSNKNTYELINSNSEVCCLINMDVTKKIKELIKFGRIFNPEKKSFLSIFSCKFKKSRMQQKESKDNSSSQKSNN